MDPPPPYAPLPPDKGFCTIELENEQVYLNYRSCNLSSDEQQLFCKIIESVLLTHPVLDDLASLAKNIKDSITDTKTWKCVIAENKIYANGFCEDVSSKTFLADVCGINILLFS